MKNDFKVKKYKDATVYTLESATSGGTSAGSVASVSNAVGGVRRRGDNLIAQEEKKEAPKPRNFVAKNAKMGGAGQHKDKKKEQKQGVEKHKKPYMEDLKGRLQELQSKIAEIKANPDYLRAAERSRSQARDTQRQYWKSPEEKAAARRTEIKRDAGIAGYSKRYNKEHPRPEIKAQPAPKHRDPNIDRSDDYSTWAAGRRDTVGENNDHEIRMASSELQAIAKNAVNLLDRVRKYSEADGLQAWQQSKITKAADYLNSVLQSISGEQDLGEGGMKDHAIQQVVDQLLDGELDPYDVMNRPQGPAQEQMAAVLQDMYDDVAMDFRLHPDDDFEQIFDRVMDRLEDEYGHSGDQGVAEGSGNDFYAMALQKYPQLKSVARETVINALNNAYEDYLMHYGYEGIGPDEESSMIDYAVKGLKQGVAEGDEYFNHLDGLLEDWQKVNRRDKTDGMSRKAVKAYRRENPGSKLKTAVTTKPSKLKKGGKAAKRRKSFCARMKGMKKAHAGAKTKRNPDSPINKALRRWNCEEDAYMNSLNAQVLEKLNPQAPVDTWVQDFQKADPNKYKQFKNKTPQKKAQMAVAAHYAANEPSKKK